MEKKLRKSTLATARKYYSCDHCNKIIPMGQKYIRVRVAFDKKAAQYHQWCYDFLVEKVSDEVWGKQSGGKRQ